VKDKFYVTTPLYYVNDRPHLGHAYTQIVADVLARFWRQAGVHVFFLTGTDEHGQKIERAAQQNSIPPQQFVDQQYRKFTELWKRLGISNDDFLRTSEKRHIDTVGKFLNLLYEKGDIYKAKYKGWYCVHCESYVPGKADAIDIVCPDCGRKPEWTEEDGYFFRLSHYQSKLLEYYAQNEGFVLPEFRFNEVKRFVQSGLRDLCISRRGFRWGIQLPFDDSFVCYVWVDALLNYVSAVGWSTGDEKFKALWPCDVHLVGKDILKFHAVIWPAMLIAAGIEPPRRVFAHGWWVIGGEKMSKSVGNIVEPSDIIEKFGADALRYFLLRETTFGKDGEFSNDAFAGRYNADLANNLGNLVSRTLTMVQDYCGARVPESGMLTDVERKIIGDVDNLWHVIVSHYEREELTDILLLLMGLVSRLNQYVESQAPWVLAKQKSERLGTVLYTTLEALRIIAIYLYPFMPDSMEELLSRLGVSGLGNCKLQESIKWGGLKTGTAIVRGESLFPRIK